MPATRKVLKISVPNVADQLRQLREANWPLIWCRLGLHEAAGVRQFLVQDPDGYTGAHPDALVAPKPAAVAHHGRLVRRGQPLHLRQSQLDLEPRLALLESQSTQFGLQLPFRKPMPSEPLVAGGFHGTSR